jgi:enamine deaminase RidA (YjgF/YER057c/UK114 family)
MLYLSGQTGDIDGNLKDGFEAQARQSMENVGAVLKQHGLGFSDVVKCTVMLSDMSKWPAFNAIYVPYFPAGKLPARSAIGANGLAGGALLELECWAYAGTE